MAKLSMKWDEMTAEMKEFWLSKACLNSRLSAYEWEELKEWEREYIRDAIQSGKGIELIE